MSNHKLEDSQFVSKILRTTARGLLARIESRSQDVEGQVPQVAEKLLQVLAEILKPSLGTVASVLKGFDERLKEVEEHQHLLQSTVGARMRSIGPRAALSPQEGGI